MNIRPGRDGETTAAADKVGDQTGGSVMAFLRDAGLEQIAATLLRSGFDDMETLLAIEDADMKDLGIPTCHVVRLRKKLQELQQERTGTKGDFDTNHPVAVFLEDAGLSQYAKLLFENGFDDMDVLFDLEDADMKDLGIPRGHAIKLKKKLREFQLQQYAQEDTTHAYMAASHQQVVQIRTPQRRGPTQISPSALPAVPSEQMKSAVEQSWEQVQALGTYTVGEILYRHTFMIMPEAIHLFPPEVRMKYREWSPDEGNDESNAYQSPALRKLFSKFVNAVGCAVVGLHDSNKVVPMLTQLGARHINYGVNEAHWETLGKAFTFTLREILRESFTQEVEAAWSMAYTFMSSIMIEGFRGAKKAAVPKQIPASALSAVPSEQMKSAVEQSWDQVQALGTYTVGEILYRHTFMIMPEAIHLFPAEVRMKYREWSPDEGNDESNVYQSPALRKLFSKFVNAVGCAVVGLHDSSKLVPMLTQLGARHINYGVNEAHWETLGKAFKSALREILRESFTQEVEAAWAMAYTFMSSIMIEGLRGAIAKREMGQVAFGDARLHGGDKGSHSGESTNGSATSDLVEVSTLGVASAEAAEA